MRIAPFFLALVGLTGGCAQLSARGPWREVATEHLRLATDADEAAARREAVRLETALASLASLAAPNRPLPARLDVLWLVDEGAVELLGVPAATGFYLPHQYGAPSSPPLIVVGGRPGHALDGRFTHELTHLLLVDALPGAPPWVTEGLAGWFSTLEMERGTLGFDAEESSRRVLTNDTYHSAPLDRVLAGDESRFHHHAFGEGLYRGALHLVGLLQTNAELHARFVAYLARLSGGEPEPTAWRATLGVVSMDELVREFDHFSLATPTPVTIKIWPGTPQQAPLAPPAVERWLARARPWDSREALVAAGANLAHAAGDDSAERHYWSGVYAACWRRWREADAELRAALARAPDFAPAVAALAAVSAHLPAGSSVTR